MSAYRSTWNVVALALVAVGLTLALGRIGLAEILAVAIPLGGIAGLYAFLYAPEAGADIGHITSWGLKVGIGAPAFIGLVGPLGPKALVPLLAFIGAAPRTVDWVQQRYVATSRGWAGARTSVAARISDRDLALAWQSSYTALQTATDVVTKARIVQVRTMLLDELERRSAPSRRSRRWVASPDQIVPGRNRPWDSVSS